MSGISLRACYAIPGISLAHVVCDVRSISLRACYYAMSLSAYAHATRRPVLTSRMVVQAEGGGGRGSPDRCYGEVPIRRGACYAMSGTDLGCATY
eukprot:1208935-Rhodomonas_salina.2